MAIKSILAPVTGYEPNAGALTSGLQLARQLGAFTDVVHLRPNPRDAVPMLAEGTSGALVDQLIEQARKEGEGRAQRAQRFFEEACRKAGIVAEGPGAAARFHSFIGDAASEVPRRGRVADLILICRVAETTDIGWRIALEAVLIESGRPVLLLPAEPSATLGETVAIAWNGSTEAARAVSAALPILSMSQRVLLLSGSKGEPVDPPLAAVTEWLGRHGIAVESKPVALERWPVGEQLVEEAARAGADFLVMGAYGHTRVRETIFGGATRSVLNESILPVLMAH